MKILRICVLGLSLCLGSTLSTSAADTSAADKSRPNIVYIMSDELAGTSWLPGV